MRSFLLGSAAVLISTAAMAADYSPPPAPVLRGALPSTSAAIDWSGFYFGGSASFAGTSNTVSKNSSIDPTLQKLISGTVVESGVRAMPLVETGRTQDSRIGFGAFIGHNWVHEDIVFGVEADYNRARLEGGLTGDRSGRIGGTVSDTQYDWTAHTDKSFKFTDYGTVRARVGYAWDNWLPYVTGGLAYARASGESFASIASFQRTYDAGGVITSQGQTLYTPSFLRDGNRSKLHFGYAVGAGVDVALTQNIFVRAEVQHLRFTNIAGTGVQLNQAKVAAAVKY